MIQTSCPQPNELDNNGAVTPAGFATERNSGDIAAIQYFTATQSLEAYELPVVGTFIHNYILPGFHYRVRLADSNEYLFNGQPMQLESIGRGYGKRITFESEDIIENNNFFWSDSNEMGFAFSIHVLFPRDIFQVYNKHDVCIGNLVIESVDEKQEIKGISYEENFVSVHVKVNIHAHFWLFQSSCLPGLCERKIPLAGTGIVTVNQVSSTLKLVDIRDESQRTIVKLLNIEYITKLVKTK